MDSVSEEDIVRVNFSNKDYYNSPDDRLVGQSNENDIRIIDEGKSLNLQLSNVLV